MQSIRAPTVRPRAGCRSPTQPSHLPWLLRFPAPTLAPSTPHTAPLPRSAAKLNALSWPPVLAVPLHVICQQQLRCLLLLLLLLPPKPPVALGWRPQHWAGSHQLQGVTLLLATPRAETLHHLHRSPDEGRERQGTDGNSSCAFCGCARI